MEKLFNHLKIFIKATSWTFFTVLFGLLHAWLFLAKQIFGNNNIDASHKLIIEGGFLFFVTGIVTSIALDFFHSRIRLNKSLEAFLFVLFPVIIMLLSTALFLIGLENIEKNFDYKTLLNIQYIIGALTLLYSIIAKSIIFSLHVNPTNYDNI